MAVLSAGLLVNLLVILLRSSRCGSESSAASPDDVPAQRRPRSAQASSLIRTAASGSETGQLGILVDDVTRQVKAGLAGPLEARYPALGSLGA